MDGQIITSFTLDELAARVASKVLASINKKPEIEQPKPQELYLTKKQVQERLHISRITLTAWTKKGTIRGYRIGRRVLYKPHEVEAALKAVSTK